MNAMERAVTPGYLLRFTIPTMIMLIFNSFYTMADGAFVSNVVGTGALSAINIVYPAVNLIFAIGIMLATGGSAIDAVSRIKEFNPKRIKFMCIIAAPEGIEAFTAAHPDVPVYCAGLDDHLNEHCYIVPGLGDAGDRIFGTK